MVRTTNGFDKRNLADFIKLLLHICLKMKDNSYFPAQQPAVLSLIAAKDEFLVLVQQAADGSKAAIIAKDEKADEIIFMLRSIGNEVTAVAQGNLIILESSGFPFSKEREASAPLVQPDAPKVSLGINKGEILCVAKKQGDSSRVTFMITSDPNAENSWQQFPDSASKYVFSNLTSGQRYYIKYMLSGVRGQIVMSDTVSYIPQ